MVHTGAKIQSGGLKEGLIIDVYQGSLNFDETMPPIMDAEKVMIKNKEKDTNLFFIIIILYNTIL